ncbi:MAG TPA: VOC family protein, partial [Gemmatimonadaceae bacterium]|nr:VOC family protein [Gemmatimonadaceae bacterium]
IVANDLRPEHNPAGIVPRRRLMFTSLFPIVATRDMTASLRFYRDLLDGKVTYEFPGPDGAVVYVSLRIGESSVGIGYEANLADAPRPRPVALWVYTDDCDAAVERLRSAGVTVTEEPTTQPWGERVARVLDPDGNEVIIGSR